MHANVRNNRTLAKHIEEESNKKWLPIVVKVISTHLEESLDRVNSS